MNRASRLAAAIAAIGCLHACSGGQDTQSNNPPPPPPSNEPSGLDTRPSNTTCLAWDRPSADDTVSVARYTNLSFSSPIAMLQAPDDASRWFVVEQGGVVRTFPATSNPASSTVYIDLTDRVDAGGEMGLLGMAFHPDFPQDPRVFLSYTNADAGRVSRISSFRTLNGGTTLDPSTEHVLLTLNQPEANHNGGNIAFGPDGMLYIGFGDGGGGGDNHGTTGNGQRLTTMLGKMLRIDIGPATATSYTVPASNPFFNGADQCPAAGRPTGNCPEIFAWGFRNPWRWSFDRTNGDLWVADVGQGDWEEVDQVTIGNNYGWRCREGAHDFNTSGCNGTAGLTDPVAEYDHSLGVSITGGYVYRGTQSTNLTGRFLFGDFGSGRLWAWIAESATRPREPTQLLDTNLSISSFGQANDGELYIVDYGGTLNHIVFQSGTVSGSVPQNLSETGCVVAADPQQPAPGLIPYAINAPFWSDGADKERWLALPDGQSITVRTDGDWDFPNRSVLMKHFRVGNRLIETRLLMRHPDGTWGGFTYEWNAQQTDATLVEGGATRDIGGQDWIFPSEAQCLECHTSAANRALGLETAQLNRSFAYAQTGRTANELATLSHIGLLSPAIPDSAAEPAMPDPFDTTAPLADRARAYLHANCSQCHRPNGPTPSTMDLRYTTALNATNACNASPQAGDLGIGANARLIAPGSSANSVLVNRANRRDSNGMPPLASNLVDAAGIALLTQWIDGLTGC
ncbi:MAG TPA: PQQ-dependent sugar dehydrogenase [Steroidobacteraceae bacterium]